MDQRWAVYVDEGSQEGCSLPSGRGELPALPPVPGGRYTDPGFLRLEREHLWRKSWLYACHADQVRAHGDYLLWDLTGSPIIIVRDGQDRIRAFYNTCRHRGAPLVRDSSGSVSGGFTCGYHGWTYGLDGQLKGIRNRGDFPGMDFDCMGLVAVRCEALGKWVFINGDPDAQPLKESLEPVATHLAAFDPKTIRHVETRCFEVECNVKLLLEGFLEVYHLMNIHPDTVDRFLDYRRTRHTLFPRGHSVMVTPNRKTGWVDPGTVGMQEFPGMDDVYRTSNVSFNLFPGLITPLSTTGMPFLSLFPRGDRNALLKIDWFSPDWGDGGLHPLWQRRMENFVRILEEDLSFVPHIQKSIESAGFKDIRLGFSERRIYHWHEELDRRIGVERIPESLRIKPFLAELALE